MRSWAFVAGAVLALASPAAAQSVEIGIKAWQRGDYEQAVAAWRPLAQKGDADAAFNLAQAYRLGRGVPLDLAQAQGWLERAARKDHVDAQTTLGLLLFENGNRTSGLRWLKKAAEHGDARAQLVYGTALFNGDGVPRDAVKAYAFVSRAAAQGLAPAEKTLEAMEWALSPEERKKAAAMPLKPSSTAPAPEKAKAKPQAKPSSPTPAPPAKKAATSGGWRIQLGAFSKRSSAEALYKRLSGRDALAGKSPFLVSGGSVTRLQVGPFANQADAARACEDLKAAGQDCFPVSAR